MGFSIQEKKEYCTFTGGRIMSFEAFLKVLAKLRWYQGHYGVDEENKEEIEEVYQDLLELLEA